MIGQTRERVVSLVRSKESTSGEDTIANEPKFDRSSKKLFAKLL